MTDHYIGLSCARLALFDDGISHISFVKNRKQRNIHLRVFLYICATMKGFALRLSCLLLLFLLIGNLSAQDDSTQRKINERLKKIENELKSNPALKKEYEDLTFYYSQVFRNIADSQKLQEFKIGGYFDAYYAHYSDHLPLGMYQKFPTSAPQSDAFALNIAQISLSYRNNKVRGVGTFHVGDIPSSAWSPKFNFIQEAWMGMKLVKNVWLDAGFFRTHLGFESIQPRENIGSSVAITTFYEPYYLSGAKLTYYLSKTFSLQASAFNGFNTFVAYNKKKSYGISAIYEPNEHVFATLNLLYSDMAPDTFKYTQRRLYNNFYLAYKSRHFNLGLEANFGIQEHTGIEDSTATSTMYSMLLAGKYKIRNGRYGIYARTEVFNDKNEILTGQIVNPLHMLVGINAFGGTFGLEYKPIENSFLRLESRYIHLWNKENIFYTNGSYTNVRMEVIASMGVWF